MPPQEHPYYADLDAFKDRLGDIRNDSLGEEHKNKTLALARDMSRHPLYRVTVFVDSIWDDTGLAERRTSAKLLDLDIATIGVEAKEGTFQRIARDSQDYLGDMLLEMHSALGQSVRAERQAEAGVLPAGHAEAYLFWVENDGDDETPAEVG